jgi:hypothetical protein
LLGAFAESGQIRTHALQQTRPHIGVHLTSAARFDVAKLIRGAGRLKLELLAHARIGATGRVLNDSKRSRASRCRRCLVAEAWWSARRGNEETKFGKPWGA